MTSMLKRITVVLSAATMLLAASLVADEGMWMPLQVPQIAAQMQKAGLKIDPKRLADLAGDPMGALVSLGGCSASFVSPDGLIITNHHCAFGAIQANSSAQRDLITNGYLAQSRADELPAPGQRAWITTGMEDVTSRVVGDLPPGIADADRARTMDMRQRDLVAECEKPGGVRCTVNSFFEGALYLRTTQTELTDLRLVYAPANSIGDFGGDIDNFEWPRHTGDFSFLRAYKDGKPYRPAHWLKIASKGIKQGDFVLVAGYPGRTFRYRTAAEVRNYQEFIYPTSIRYYTELIDILETAGKNDRAIAIRNASRVKSLNNSLKNYQSVVAGFTKDRILEQRLWRERQMRNAIVHDKSLAQYAPVLSRIDALNAEEAATRESDLLLGWIVGNGAAPRSSPMLTSAMQLYRASVERTKKPADRAAGFLDKDLARLKESTERMQRMLDPASDRAGLRFFLGESQKLPDAQRIKPIDKAIAAAGGIDPLLDRLYGTTKVGEAASRVAMSAETTAQLKARHDPMLDLAASLLPVVEANEARERARRGAMAQYRPEYAEVLRRMMTGSLYPDANGTLRLTYGTVAGYLAKDAVVYLPRSTVAGVLQKDTGKEPFDSPKRLLDAAKNSASTKPYLDPEFAQIPVDFLSTCDTTGGNSGSPTLNANGELVGLLFDGNYESIDADFLFNPDVTRSIHVDMQYVLWIMDAVDGAHELMREMGVTPKLPMPNAAATPAK